jgi:ABC-2 type transport system permease protein
VAIFLIFVLLSVALFPRLKRVLQQEKYWGKV